MDIDPLPPGVTYLLLERVDPKQNENRFYYLAWQPVLVAEEALVRSYRSCRACFTCPGYDTHYSDFAPLWHSLHYASTARYAACTSDPSASVP
jgi:hypothetical protein